MGDISHFYLDSFDHFGDWQFKSRDINDIISSPTMTELPLVNHNYISESSSLHQLFEDVFFSPSAYTEYIYSTLSNYRFLWPLYSPCVLIFFCLKCLLFHLSFLTVVMPSLTTLPSSVQEEGIDRCKYYSCCG